jgi:hypothetical protein
MNMPIAGRKGACSVASGRPVALLGFDGEVDL